MACNNCASVELSNCNSTLVIQSDLPEGEYQVFIDRQLSRYSQTVTATEEGEITIDVSLLPKGFFNPYGGDYFIEIDGQDIFNYPQIGCIRASVRNGSFTQNIISLDTITLPPQDDTTQYSAHVIEFTLQSQLVIPYTGLRNRYGPSPTVQVWVYDSEGQLANMLNSITFDAYPVNTITADFGGIASGIIVIS